MVNKKELIIYLIFKNDSNGFYNDIVEEANKREVKPSQLCKTIIFEKMNEIKSLERFKKLKD